MQQFRIFIYSATGYLTDAHEFHVLNDEGAVELIERLREARRVELWRRDLKLRVWGKS